VSVSIQKSKHLKESSIYKEFSRKFFSSRTQPSKAGAATLWCVAWSLEKFHKHSLLFYFICFISLFSWRSRQSWGMLLFLHTPLNFVTGNISWQSVSSRLFCRPLSVAGSPSLTLKRCSHCCLFLESVGVFRECEQRLEPAGNEDGYC
jgi:hypothetical protein